jgi:glycosyltransferase involved in cell wall biosynthesis
MRIVHINLERTWRGGERQVLYLMEGLRRLGHECHLVARTNDIFISRAREQGFPVHVIKKPFVLSGHLFSGFDVVHAHETRGLQVAALWKTFNKKPLIFTRRVDNPPSGNILTRLVYSRIDSMAAISETISSVMKMWGFDASRIKVIYSAIETQRYVRQDAATKLKKRFGSKKVVGCVASLEKRKDHYTLLKAAHLIQRQRDDVVFVLVGAGDLRADLEREVSLLGLKNVMFEGYQDDPYSYYQVFDVFVMTSRQEGLGSSILDAFSYRVPVVATAAGGIPEIIKDHETGLLAEVSNPDKVALSIMQMLDDEELRKRCTDSAYVFLMERFTLDRMAQSYEQMYQEVLRCFSTLT